MTDFGLLTTPQLHHIVRMANSPNPALHRRASEEGYYTMLADAYKAILHVRVSSSLRYHRALTCCVCSLLVSRPLPARRVLRCMRRGGCFASEPSPSLALNTSVSHVPMFSLHVQGVDPAPSKRGPVVFDGAHGIGAPKLALLAPKLAGVLNIAIRNGVEVSVSGKEVLHMTIRFSLTVLGPHGMCLPGPGGAERRGRC